MKYRSKDHMLCGVSKMPFSTPLNKLPKTSLSVVMTSPNSVPKGAFSVSPNLKEISETLIWTRQIRCCL